MFGSKLRKDVTTGILDFLTYYSSRTKRLFILRIESIEYLTLILPVSYWEDDFRMDFSCPGGLTSLKHFLRVLFQ